VIKSNITLFGIIGNPVKHSLSPVMHNTAFKSLGVGDTLYLGYYVPQSDDTKNLYWQRLKYAKVVLKEPLINNNLVSHKRRFDVEELLQTEKLSFSAKYALSIARMPTGSAEVRSLKEYATGGQYDWGEGVSSQYDLKNSISKDGVCAKHGSWPAIPKLTYPSGYVPAGAINPDQLELRTSRDRYGRTYGNGANAAKSLANGRLFFEEVLRTLTKSSDAFWAAYDKGVYDESLKNEYAYWLYEGKKYNLGGRAPRTALDVFTNIATTSTRGKFSYHIVPAIDRDTYQFLTNSKCSPIKSKYRPEEDAAVKLRDIYDKTSSAVLFRYGSLKEYLEKKIDYKKTNYKFAFDFSKDWGRTDISGVRECLRAAITLNVGQDVCDTPLFLTVKANKMSYPIFGSKRVNSNPFKLDVLHSYIDSISANLANSYSHISDKCRSDNRNILKYLFYTNPDINLSAKYEPVCPNTPVADYLVSNKFGYEVEKLLSEIILAEKTEFSDGKYSQRINPWEHMPRFAGPWIGKHWKSENVK